MCEYKFGDYILPTDHLSASSLGVFKRCERQYKFRYVDGITLPASYAQAAGSILHACLQNYFDSVLDGHRPTPDEAADLAADACENYVDRHETDMTAEEFSTLKPEVRSALLDYIESVGKDVIPIATEDGFIIKMRCGVPIMGFIDLKLRHGDDIVIGDYKLTAKKWTGSDLVNSLQFNLYAHLTGIPHVQVHNITRTAPKSKPRTMPPEEGVVDFGRVRIIEHRFSSTDWPFWEDLVESAAERITSGVFAPGDPSAWHCTPEYCGYWQMCRGKRA